MDDFVVDTNEHCFLCLRVVRSLPPDQAIYSLQYFSRYLRMDMGKVFSTNGPISPDLLAKVERAKLKAELCGECGFMTERLSALYRQLEKIEMEIAFYVKDIHMKLVAAETGQLRTSIQSDFAGKLEIVNSLRNEAAAKCYCRLEGKLGPRVKVENQTEDHLNEKRLKIQSRSRTNPVYNTHHNPSRSDNLVDSPSPKTEVDADLQPWNSPSNSILNEDNEYDDSTTCAPDNSSTSTALVSETKPGIVPTTPQSSVNPKTGKHKCKICSNEFSSSSNFWAHYKAVHLKMRYKCSLCSNEFTYYSNYRRHLRSEHMGIKFKCEVCAKAFGQKVHLQSHLKSSNCGKKRASSPK